MKLATRLVSSLALTGLIGAVVSAPAAAAEVSTIVNGVVYGLDGDGAATVLTRTAGVPKSLTIESAVTIGASSYVVTSIAYSAFYREKNLVSVTIPDSVTLIDDGAFAKMPALESVTVGNGVVEIADGAFYSDPKLSSVKLGTAVKSIGNGAFGNDPKLASITIPATVTSILDWAFAYDYALSSVTFLGAAPFMDNMIFFLATPTVYFPARFNSAIVAKGYTTPKWYGLNSVSVEDPLNLTPTPMISGVATVGRTLTANPGAWDSGVALSYKWYRSGSVITGATSTTYSLLAADFGKTMTVTVTGAKNGFKTVSKTSVATAKVSR